MFRRTAATSAALVALATVAACTSTDDAPDSGDTITTTTPSTDDTTPSRDDGPIVLAQIADGTSLAPGTYAVGLLADDGPTRAIVDVPEGFFSDFGGTVIGSDDGDVAFWGKVTQVDTDPCRGGEHVSAGTSVRDLATLLAAERNMTTSHPVPVTIGGYSGVYLKLTAPADIGRCRGGTVTIYSAGGGGWLQLDVPRATFYQWILNVKGQRVVGGARIAPDSAHRSDLIAMVTSAEFTVADE
jgi:hypothetical protein